MHLKLNKLALNIDIEIADMTHIDPEWGDSKKNGKVIPENAGKYILSVFNEKWWNNFPLMFHRIINLNKKTIHLINIFLFSIIKFLIMSIKYFYVFKKIILFKLIESYLIYFTVTFTNQ